MKHIEKKKTRDEKGEWNKQKRACQFIRNFNSRQAANGSRSLPYEILIRTGCL